MFRAITKLNLAAMAVSLVPLYGYFVHAARDSSSIGLIIILCWFLTVICLLVSLGSIIVNHFKSMQSTQTIKFAAYFFVMAPIGYGGVYNAFFELIAG